MQLRSLVTLVVVAFLLAGCAVGGAKTTTVTVTTTVTSPVGPKKPHPAQAETGNVKYFGRPISVTRLDDNRYALAIRPEFFLVGVTANVVNAAQQQNACQPLECPGVDDDHLVLPAGSQSLVFILPATTKGTVIDSHMKNVTVTADQLATIAARPEATTPKLIEGLASGLWLTVDVDTVTSFAQQFQP